MCVCEYNILKAKREERSNIVDYERIDNDARVSILQDEAFQQ